MHGGPNSHMLLVHKFQNFPSAVATKKSRVAAKGGAEQHVWRQPHLAVYNGSAIIVDLHKRSHANTGDRAPWAESFMEVIEPSFHMLPRLTNLVNYYIV